MELTAAQQKCFAYWLTRSLPSDSLGKLTASLQDAQVDLTPHQIDTALFAFKSPLSKGAVLADEVGRDKTIESGIILSQFRVEPQEKFFLPSRILESKTFNHYMADGNPGPFNCEEINKEYNADMLAAAMVKHQGFTFSPDSEMYWKQGHGTEHDFIFSTTQLITAEMLETIHDQLGEDESLMICYTKFQPECRNNYSNITIKKIPKVFLDTCEFDHDDYSLNIVSVPDIDDEEWEENESEDDVEFNFQNYD